MYIDAKKIKNYFTNVLKHCDIIENFLVAFIVTLLVFTIDKLNLMTAIGDANDWFKGVIIITTTIGFVLLITIAVYEVKGKSLTITDAFIEIGLIGFLLSIVYIAISYDAFLPLKILVTCVLLLITLVLIVIRSNYFVEYECEPCDERNANNSSLTVYFKNFFKRHWVTVLVAAIIGISATLLFEEANIYMKLRVNKNAYESLLLVVAVVLLSLVVVLKDRIHIKRCNLVDATAFVLLFADLTLFVEAFTLHVNQQQMAITIAIVGLLVAIILFAFLAYNTHFEVVEPKTASEKGIKASFAGYIKKVFDNHHLGVIMAVNAFVVATICSLESTNILGIFMSTIEVEEWVIIATIFGIIALLFTIISYELPSKKVVLIDTLLVSIFIIFITLTILSSIGFKTIFDLKVLLYFATTIISAIFIAIRILVVKMPAVTEVKVESLNVATEMAVAEEVEEVEEIVTRISVKKSHEIHLRTADSQLKKAYETIRNALETYKLKSRITKNAENFSRTGITPSKIKEGKPVRLQVKLQIRGKFIKMFMNLDPIALEKKNVKFRQKDVSKKYKDQPTLIKVRSNLSIKYALLLIDMLAIEQGFVTANDKKGLTAVEVAEKLKEKHLYKNYAELYSDENLTYMQKAGYEHVVQKYFENGLVKLQDVKNFSRDFAEKVVISKLISDPHRYIYDEVTLETLEKSFRDGDLVTLETMRNAGVIKKNANFVTVKASETLSKKLIVEANVIEPNAVSMIFIAGGIATRIVGE